MTVSMSFTGSPISRAKSGVLGGWCLCVCVFKFVVVLVIPRPRIADRRRRGGKEGGCENKGGKHDHLLVSMYHVGGFDDLSLDNHAAGARVQSFDCQAHQLFGGSCAASTRSALLLDCV